MSPNSNPTTSSRLLKLTQRAYLSFLRLATRLELRKNNPLIVAVTGSSGKTTAVLAITAALGQNFQVEYTKKGNSETGIPFEIFKVIVGDFSWGGWMMSVPIICWRLLTSWPKNKIWVMELGIDSPHWPKNMTYHLSYLKPRIGVLLGVSSVHAANFEPSRPLSSISLEKAKLLFALPKDGLAVLSKTVPEITKILSKIKAEKQFFSLDGADSAESNSGCQLLKYQVNFKGSSFDFQVNHQAYQLFFPKLCQPKNTFGSFASAIIVAHHLGLTVLQAITNLESNFKVPPGRMTILDGINGATLIDSSYNASAESMSGALEMIKTIPAPRRVVVLGDMREIGYLEQSEHEKIAHQAAQVADVLVFVGVAFPKYAPPIISQHFPNKEIYFFPKASQALSKVRGLLKTGDLCLIKGSQNTLFLEIVVKGLLKNPVRDSEKLCRQTPFYDQQRAKLL